MYDYSSKKPYKFQQFQISQQIMKEIYRYIELHQPPNKFLQAVIENNLTNAIAYADDDTINNIPAFVAFFYSHAPSQCYGSPEAFARWTLQITTKTIRENLAKGLR